MIEENSFQFQYGAIISIRCVNKDSPELQVSIPIWCDYKKIYQ